MHDAFIQIVTNMPDFQRNADNIANFMRLEGGMRRAALIVELAASIGTNHLDNFLQDIPLYARWHIDLTIARLLLLICSILLALVSILKCCLGSARSAARHSLQTGKRIWTKVKQL
jgi:hypothetical protein